MLGRIGQPSHSNADMEDTVVFTIAGARLQEKVARASITKEASPMLYAIVNAEDEAPQAQRDDSGRFILEGPTEEKAFSTLMTFVRDGRFNDKEMLDDLPTLEARLQACRYADYYLLPGHAKMRLTQVLLKNFVSPTRAEGGTSRVCHSIDEPLDVARLGLCCSQMILERIHLQGVNVKGLQLSNSHVKSVMFVDCKLADCDFGMCVTANEVHVSRSILERVKLGLFATKITIQDHCQLVQSNIRTIEELSVSNCVLRDCSFKGSNEDQKDRQIIAAAFKSVEIYGDVYLPFDRISCELTHFHGDVVRMSKSGASISFAKTRLVALPDIQSDVKVNLCLESCEVAKALTFKQMHLKLNEVRFCEAPELVDVEFVDRVEDITFPAGSRFSQVRFKHGLQACVASDCRFEGCNFGYSQDAVSSCLLTRSSFQACRFPFLEADAPVANFSDSKFIACRIQWSGQFPHEESFLINSYWCRKWNLHGASVTDGS